MLYLGSVDWIGQRFPSIIWLEKRFKSLYKSALSARTSRFKLILHRPVPLSSSKTFVLARTPEDRPLALALKACFSLAFLVACPSAGIMLARCIRISFHSCHWLERLPKPWQRCPSPLIPLHYFVSPTEKACCPQRNEDFEKKRTICTESPSSQKSFLPANGSLNSFFFLTWGEDSVAQGMCSTPFALFSKGLAPPKPWS